jgi:hypothetical protein
MHRQVYDFKVLHHFRHAAKTYLMTYETIFDTIQLNIYILLFYIVSKLFRLRSSHYQEDKI